MTVSSVDRRRPLPTTLGLLAFVAATAVASVLAALTVTGTADRYGTLDQPGWAPPSWLFGPVWTVLYVAIAIAGWLVWRRTGTSAELIPYAIQLVLNAAWTPIFFGAGEYGWAAVDIIALWIAIVGTIIGFARVHRLAAALLLPYLAWVSFATALNLSIWHLNR